MILKALKGSHRLLKCHLTPSYYIFFCVQIIEWDKYFHLLILFLFSSSVARGLHYVKKAATNFRLTEAHFLIYIRSKRREEERDGCIIIIKIMKRLRNHLENLMRYRNFVLEGVEIHPEQACSVKTKTFRII